MARARLSRLPVAFQDVHRFPAQGGDQQNENKILVFAGITVYAFSGTAPRKKWPSGQLASGRSAHRGGIVFAALAALREDFFEPVDNAGDAGFDQNNVEIDE